MFDTKKQPFTETLEPQEDISKKSIEQVKNIVPDLSVKKESKIGVDQQTIQVSNSNIHTMPEKFLPGGGKQFITESNGKKSKKVNNNLIIGIVIGILVLVLVGLMGWFLLQSVKTPVTDDLIVEQMDKKQETVQQENEENKEQIEDQMSEEENDVVNDLCSVDNCGKCSVDECKELEDGCHVEDVCKTDENIDFDKCPKFVCVIGQKVGDDNDNNQEVDLESETPVTELVMSKDTDYDLLTDIEEGVWGTDPTNSDTDSDTYTDGVEIKHLFNPTVSGADSGKLIDSDLIKNYINTKYGYSIYYPSGWEKNDNDEQYTLFTAKTGEFIEVLVQENDEHYTNIKDWYLSQYPGVAEDKIEEVLIGNWSGIRSDNKLSLSLLNNNYIYTILYNNGLKNELNYQTTFEMMLNSFQLFESPTE